MSPPDESLPSDDRSFDPDATTYRPSSDPDATEYHVSSGTSSPSAGFTPGSRLNDNFRLEKQLGRGGMGEAWKAFDETANRFVVLKFIPKEIQHVKEAVDSVRDSFAKVHELQHQHICPVYGLFTDPHHGLYLVMKFIDGLPLDEYKRHFIEKHGKMSFSDTVQILWGIAKGLDYAHEKRVIHRDIKPQNVMISKKDGVQIIDFGLAEEIRTSMVRFSEAAMDIAGTRPYMAPEQWQGRLQDARTDQYALAVTSYELFAGHVPFHGSDIGILRECVLRDPPRPIEGLPDHVNAALLKGLAKKRDDRFENCKAFVKAMAAKPKAGSADAELVPDQGHAEVSVVPTLHSDPADGRTQAPFWRPEQSTDPRRRIGRRKNTWFPVLSVLSVVLLVSGLVAFFSSQPPQPDITKIEKKTPSTGKPAPKPKKERVSSIAAPAVPVAEKSQHEIDAEIADLVVNKLKRIVELKLPDNEPKGYIATKQYVVENPWAATDPLPKDFIGLHVVNLRPNDHSCIWDRWEIGNKNPFPCVVPGIHHHSTPCTCELAPEDIQSLARIKKLSHLAVCEMPWKVGDWDILFKNLEHLGSLDISSTPPMPHWRSFESVQMGALFSNCNTVLPVHFESVSKIRGLEELHLWGSTIAPESMRHLKGNARIKKLTLSACSSLETDDFQSLTEMKALERIDLVNTVMTDGQLMILAGVEKLKHLSLGSNGISRQGLEAFKVKRPDVEVDWKGPEQFPVWPKEVPAGTGEVFLGDLLWESAETPFSSPGPQRPRGDSKAKFDRLWVPAPSTLTYRLGGQWETFTSKIGLKTDWATAFPHRYLFMPGGNAPSVRFIVKGDGREIYRSEIIRGNETPSLSLDVSGVDLLELTTDDAGDGARFDTAIWFGPKLSRNASAAKNDSPPISHPTVLSNDEKKSLQQKYPELDWTGAKIVVLPEPAETELRQAYVEATKSGGNHFIIVRTTPENRKIVLNDGSLTFPGKPGEKRTVSLIALGPEKLILDGDRKDRIAHIRDGAEANFCGIVFTNGSVTDDSGGGIRVVTNATVRLLRCDVIDNACVPVTKCHAMDGFGGGGVLAWNQCSIVLRDVLFEGNRIADPAVFDKPKSKEIEYSNECFGGLGLLDRCSLVAANVVFRKNYGGAMHASDMKAIDLRGIALIDNKMRAWSGAAYLHGIDADRTYRIVNLFATGNTGGHLGGALHIGGKGRFVLDHLTLVGNESTGQGGGICFGGGGHKIRATEVVLTNSIIAGNHSARLWDFAVNEEKIEKLEIHNCITSEGDQEERKRFSDGQNNRFLQPGKSNLGELQLGRLRDFGNGIPVMPLLSVSPAVDAGIVTENTPETDLTGRPRRSGKAPDIGAFEFQDDSTEDPAAASGPPLSDDEKRSLQQKYPEIDWTGANIIVLPEPTETSLRRAFVEAAKTPGNDIIVARTTKDRHRIVLEDGQITFNYKAAEKGGVALVSLGPEKLILDGNRQDRIFIARGGVDASFAGIVFTNTYLVDANGAINIGVDSTIRILCCDFIDNVNVPEKRSIWWEGFGGAGMAAWSNTSIFLRDVLFEGNRNNHPGVCDDAEKRKGANVCRDSSAGLLVNDNCELFATAVVFRNNDGGAAFLHAMKALELRNISLIDNKSLGGGAIHVYGNDEDRTYKITNLFATGNRSGKFGGALHIGGKGRYVLNHLTLVKNTGDIGGGVCFGGGGDYRIDAREIELSNSIIERNRGVHINNIAANEGKIGKWTIRNCFIWEQDPEMRRRTEEGANNRAVGFEELKFGELADFGNGIPVFPVLEGSPAIDAGIVTDDTPETDITGRPRNVGKAPDIGAFEFR